MQHNLQGANRSLGLSLSGLAFLGTIILIVARQRSPRNGEHGSYLEWRLSMIKRHPIVLAITTGLMYGVPMSLVLSLTDNASMFVFVLAASASSLGFGLFTYIEDRRLYR